MRRARGAMAPGPMVWTATASPVPTPPRPATPLTTLRLVTLPAVVTGLTALTALTALAVLTALAGCGSGGGLSGPAETPPPPVTQTVAPPLGGTPSVRPPPTGKHSAFKGVEMLLPLGWRLGPVVRDSTCALPPDQVSCLGGPPAIQKGGAGGRAGAPPPPPAR